MSVLTTKPTFLYPHAKVFPFDEVCEKIVRALERRNFDVPGIEVSFYTYGSGKLKYQMVEKVIGSNFEIDFMRGQGELDEEISDIAAVDTIKIPRQIIHVYEDLSGPKYWLYVGGNWKDDKDWFFNSIKLNAKSNNEKRRYLVYNRNIYDRSQIICDGDLDREYMPKGNEPVSIDIEAKYKQFTKWITKNVLNYILSFDEAENIKSPERMESPILYKGPFETIYSFCTWKEAENIKDAKEGLAPLSKMYAKIGTGTRLIPLSVNNNGRFPEEAYEGFIWCDTSKNFSKDVIKAMTYSENPCTVIIKLKYANRVFVADNALYIEKRKKLFEEIAPRDELTYEELGDAYAARGASIVPITDYKGGYKEPIVLIERELELEEVEKII